MDKHRKTNRQAEAAASAQQEQEQSRAEARQRLELMADILNKAATAREVPAQPKRTVRRIEI